MTDIKPYVREVRYYECDRMGVTHHSNYIRFMEEARIDWMDQLGYGFEKMEAEGIVSPVISLTCNYKRPTTFKDRIVIEVKVDTLSALKIGFRYVMKCGDVVVFTAESLHCFLDAARPISMEERFPALFKLISDTL